MGGYKPEDEISFNNREDYFTIPVPAKDLEIVTPGQNESWNTTDTGPFKAIGHPGLTSLTYESFFPAHDYSFCRVQPMAPLKYIAKLKRFQESRRPIRFIRTGVINDAFAIEGFSYRKEVGTGDIYFTLELERYRFRSSSNPETDNDFRDGTDLNIDGKVDTTLYLHTLIKGETLTQLADEWLGDSDRWREIWDMNRDTMHDPGHPWDQALADRGEKQVIKIQCEEGTPGYAKIVGSYLGKEPEEI